MPNMLPHRTRSQIIQVRVKCNSNVWVERFRRVQIALVIMRPQQRGWDGGGVGGAGRRTHKHTHPRPAGSSPGPALLEQPCLGPGLGAGALPRREPLGHLLHHILWAECISSAARGGQREIARLEFLISAAWASWGDCVIAGLGPGLGWGFESWGPGKDGWILRVCFRLGGWAWGH